MHPVRLLIADDNELARAGARSALQAAPEVAVVGEAADGPTALRSLERAQANMLLVDLHLPGLDAVGLLRRLAPTQRPRTIVICGRADAASMVECIGVGARGFLNLASAAQELVPAVRAVFAGLQWLRPPLSDDAFACAAAIAESVSCDPYHSLTDREREVLVLAAEGHNNAAIGRRLHISPRTVEIHRSRALRKLGLGSQTDLVRYALRRGLLTLES